jgi:hypothetical protein
MKVNVQAGQNFGRIGEIRWSTKDLMEEIGHRAIVLIKRRTAQGRDVDNAPFAEYSEGYAKRKREALGTTGGVNLSVSGAMLDRMDLVEVTDHSVTLGWS